MLLFATALAACASDPMQNYYACRKHGIGVESCRGSAAIASRPALG